jgi:small subunit ribosomal protein S16
MIKIRLKKIGKRNDVFYRIVAIPGELKNTGKALDNIGYWYPAKNEKVFDKKKLDKWVKNGAQVSAAVKQLLA